MNAPIIHATLSTQPFSKWFEVHPGLGISMMDHLFNRLDGAYPHKWRSNFANQQAIDNWCESWAEAFEEERITPNDIKAGLKAVRSKFDWPPSCAEFIKACRPDTDPLKAYYEAISGVQARAKGEMGYWSSPAVYWAAMPLSFDLGNQTYSQIKPRWERALAEQIERGQWESIPVPMIALPAPGKSELSRENASKMIADLGAAGVVKSAATQEDHKLWAKKIIERIKYGDQTISLIQRKFAEEAIANKARA